MTIAALDVGSNTIRLLVARAGLSGLEILADRSEFVRLGSGVDSDGRLQPERREAAVKAIADLTAAAHELGASEIVAVATSAVRDARDGDEFTREVAGRTGTKLRILSGKEEARLTFLGTARSNASEQGAIVCDLGGGSAELIAAKGQHMLWARSLQVGSGRLTERYVRGDPPEHGELEAIREYVRGVLCDLPSVDAEVAILTGGTATHLALLAGNSEAAVRLQPSDVGRVAGVVARKSSDALIREYDVRPERARVLAAGVIAVSEITLYFKVSEIVVTKQGIREGILLDYVQNELTAR